MTTEVWWSLQLHPLWKKNAQVLGCSLQVNPWCAKHSKWSQAHGSAIQVHHLSALMHFTHLDTPSFWLNYIMLGQCLKSCQKTKYKYHFCKTLNLKCNLSYVKDLYSNIHSKRRMTYICQINVLIFTTLMCSVMSLHKDKQGISRTTAT